MARNLDSILERHRRDPTRLVQILRDVMDVAGWIEPRVLTELAAALGLSRAQVEGVAGFYAFFATEPRGRFRVLFSDGITDEMAGSRALMQRMLDAFRLQPGEVSRDGLLSVGTTSCTGMCDQGPALLVNGHAIARLTPARIGAVCSLIRGGSPVEQWPDNLLAVDSHLRRRGALLDTPLAPGEALAAAVARGAQGTLDELVASGLRGRGGAGYPAGVKWQACARAPGARRVIVCNADEGEPGTFKDRELLVHRAEAVLEGMTVAAFAVGAQQGFIYLRGEYLFLAAPLERALAARRAAGLLGRGAGGVAGLDFDIELHLGAGAYVCGEESALIESLEGKRGIPRNRPPYPVTHGYLQRPTVVNNVETLAAAALVARHGAAWYRAQGTSKSPGTKLFSVAGDVERPGTYEHAWGLTLGELLADAGARDVQAVQVGGPSGTLLAADELDRRLAFEDLPTAGAVTVIDRSRDMVAVVDNFVRFFAHESCGFCTPCRVGTTLNRQMLGRVRAGEGSLRDLHNLEHVAQLLREASHCGLGTSAGNPLRDALARFRPAFERRLSSLDSQATFDLDAALAPAREATAREDAGAFLGDGREDPA